jgi:hypothetical protein
MWTDSRIVKQGLGLCDIRVEGVVVGVLLAFSSYLSRKLLLG